MHALAVLDFCQPFHTGKICCNGYKKMKIIFYRYFLMLYNTHEFIRQRAVICSSMCCELCACVGYRSLVCCTLGISVCAFSVLDNCIY